jgi:hypothetical protein
LTSLFRAGYNSWARFRLQSQVAAFALPALS